MARSMAASAARTLETDSGNSSSPPQLERSSPGKRTVTVAAAVMT